MTSASRSSSPWWLHATAIPDFRSEQGALARQNELTKPPGSLGMLEEVAIKFAAWQGQVKPQIQLPQCVVFAADHGVAAQGVSAFPQAVTVEMLKNFIAGGAAISVLARFHQMGLTVVNCGTAIPCEYLQGVIHRPVAAGTEDFSLQAAMTNEQAQQALDIGAEIIDQLEVGSDLFIAGEMGIGNTSAATCLAAMILDLPATALVGPGTGVTGENLHHKQQVLAASMRRAKEFVESPLQALEQVGGFELGAIAGAYIRAAQRGIPILVDGFIASTAALLAVQLNEGARDWMLFGHQSAEPGHARVLEALDAEPLLQLNMRLGEGSGAATALTIVKQALALHNEMATFAEASVSGQHLVSEAE
ncbi:nicotinate-nucleotide--dimethylbenzimidazole phosphoribosyltransferase [Thalassolituus sp.]|jgi:nicotinate-nucleotide--dimethylbenzimidazole phosphoribosyltransferase|uniref:nicotinate-nucleotide--dimethylbenzimidazole phosphoribosyltransferase n=1 Tax=Thalassolituus sp. TaxID=2030822 RepID=UPI0032D97C84